MIREEAVQLALNSTRDSFRQFLRNGRWGTCADCPRNNEGHAYPELCKHFSRYDHYLSIDDLASNYSRNLASIMHNTTLEEPLLYNDGYSSHLKSFSKE